MSFSRSKVASRLRIAAVLGAATLSAAGARAATWTSLTPGVYNWSDAANWSIAPNYPGDGVAADNVAGILLSSPIGGTITVNNGGLAGPLTSLSLGSGTSNTNSDALVLNINGVTSVTGNLSATSSAATGLITLNVNANTTVGGTLTATAGTFVNVGNNATLAVTGPANLAGTTLSLNSGTLTAASANFSSAGSYTLNANGRIAVTGNVTTNNSNLVFSLNDPTSSVSIGGNYGGSAAASGQGGLTVNGSGNFTIAGTYQTSGSSTTGNLNLNTSGTVTIGTLQYGRTLSGDANLSGTGTGVHITNGTVNITNFQHGTANSSVTGDITGGTLTVSNEFSIGRGNTGRRTVFAVNGGTVVSTDTVNGIVVGRSQQGTANSANGWLQVNSGTLTAERLQLGGGNNGSFTGTTAVNTGTLGMSGGYLYLGSGGIVGVTQTAIAGVQVGSTYGIDFSGGIIGAKADWSSSANMNLSGTATFQAADAAGAPRNISLSGALSGGGSLVKTGTGVLTLSGNNTFGGGVTISSGTVLANAGSGSALGTGAVSVSSGATLGGSGNDSTVGGITVDSGGILAPGIPGLLGGVGTLNVNALTLNSNAVLNLDFTSSPAANDRINIQGSNPLVATGPVLVNMFTGGTTNPFNFNGEYHIITGIDSAQGGNNFNLGSFVWNNDPDGAGGLSVSFSLVNTTGTLQDLVMTVTGGISSTKWTGAAGTNWDVAGNWSAGIPNAAGAVANFLGDATGYTIAPNGTRIVGTMSIDSGTNSGYTFTGGQITLNNSGSGAAVGVSGGDNQISSAIELADNTTITTLAASNTLTLAGNITSATGRGLTILGPGKVLLSGTNSYGTTTIGPLANVQVGAGGATGSFGTGAVSNGGQILFNLGTAATIPNAISGAGTLTQGGSGAVTLAGLNSYTGPTIVNAGSSLIVDYTAGGLASTTTVFAPGTVSFRGGPAGGTQTFSTALNLQGGTLNVVGGTGGTMAVSFASALLGDNGTVNVSGDTGAAALALTNISFGATNTFNVGGTTGGSLSLSSGTIPAGVTINANAGGTVTLTAATTTFADGATVNVGGGSAPAHLFATASVINPTTALSVKSNGIASLGNTTFNGLSTLGINGGTATLGTLTLPLRAEVTLAGSGATLDLGAFVRSGLGAFNVSGPGTISTNSTNSGFVGGWATLNGSDFAAISGTTVAASTSVDNTWTGDNVSVTANTSVPAGSTANSLRFKTPGAFTVTLSGTANTLTSGAILVASAVGPNTSMVSGGGFHAAPGQEIIVNQRNTAGSLVINSAIGNNGGTSALTKLGPGRLVLAGPFGAGGVTNVVEGALELGSSTVYTPATPNGGWNILASSEGVELAGQSATITTLTGGGNITNSTSTITSVLTVANNANATYSGVISGTVDFVKTGTGQLTMRGENTFTGVSGGAAQVIVSGGTLLADHQNGAAVNVFPATSTLVLRGGTFLNNSRANTNTNQVFANTVVDAGHSLIDQGVRQSSGREWIHLGPVTRTPGATVNIDSETSNASGIFTTNPSGSILGGYATAGDNTWAFVTTTASQSDGTQNLISGGATYNAASGTPTLGTGVHTDMTASLTAGTPDNTAATVRFNTATPAVLDLTTGTHTIETGGILVTNAVGANTSTIQGGSLTSGNGSDLILIQNNTNAGLTIASAVVNSTGGPIGLTKSGGGVASLTGDVSYTGTTWINAGTLNFAGAAPQAIGSVVGSGRIAVAAGSSLTTGAVKTGSWQVGGTHTLQAGAGASRTGSLIIAGATGAWTGKLDVKNNALIVTAADAAAQAATLGSLRDQLLSGRAGGTWNGNGITSSSIPANSSLALVDAGDLNLTAFAGETGLNANTSIITIARNGDATLDGKVDAFDLNVLASNWQLADKAWSTGDFTFDGKVDAFDLNTLASNWQAGVSGSLEAALAHFPILFTTTPVPEPASLAVLALGGAALLGRRRRS